MSFRITLAGSALLAVAALSACSDSSGPASTGGQVAFQLATSPGAGSTLNALLAGTETIGLGDDTIVVTKVEVVLREIELERVAGPNCDDIDEDDCEELEIGPLLVDLPLGGGASRAFTVSVDTGSYSEIEFEVHKPEDDDSTDAGFIALHPDFAGISIRMTGTWNGTPFSFTSDLSVEQEIELVPPITVTDAAGANLTLLVDLASWFRNEAATGLINPATATLGGELEGEVKSNIEASFHAFEDDDRDGEDDHGED